jgi:TonB family protein
MARREILACGKAGFKIYYQEDLPMKRCILVLAAVFLLAGSVTAWACQENSGGAEKGKAVNVEKDVTKPVLAEKIDPKSPEEAKKEKLQGAVKLDAIIGTDGRVVELKSVESPDVRLTKAATDAVRNWKFKPAVNSKGKPVKVKITLTVNFKLQ